MNGTLAAVVTLAMTVVQRQAPAPVPANVRQRAEAAGVTAPVVAWCGGQFRPGQQGYAVAAGGRYLVIDGNGPAASLATFKSTPELACYTRAQALALHRDIQRSETLSGRIAPRFETAVVCGFVDATTATCWQYSPSERVFVEVGTWST